MIRDVSAETDFFVSWSENPRYFSHQLGPSCEVGDGLFSFGCFLVFFSARDLNPSGECGIAHVITPEKWIPTFSAVQNNIGRGRNQKFLTGLAGLVYFSFWFQSYTSSYCTNSININRWCMQGCVTYDKLCQINKTSRNFKKINHSCVTQLYLIKCQ